jgi:hypothetical protein
VEIEAYLRKLERNLMLGAGRWVAEFNEAFRNFPLATHTFDLFVRGGTRPKGFLLSRLFAYFSLPSYNVGLFVKHVPEDGFSLEDLTRSVTGRAAEKNIRWTWLVLIRTGSFPDKLVKTVDAFDKPELGISLVNLADRDIDTSSNLLGRKALNLVRIFK